jgi:flagellar biosynthetic protein FliR
MLGLPPVTPDGALGLVQAATGYAEPEVALALFGVVLARMLGFVMIAPFFGSMNIPMIARIGFSVALSLVLTPIMMGNDTIVASVGLSGDGFNYLWMLANQVLVGLFFGFIAAFLFYGIESAGRIIDIQRGANMSEVVAPMTGERSSASGQWLMMLAIVLMLVTGQHMIILNAVISTFEIFPPVMSLDWASSQVVNHFADLSGQSLLVTAQIAAPAMITLLLTDVLLGIINRGAPQVNVFVLSQVIKGPIAILAMLVSLEFVAMYITGDISGTSTGIPTLYSGEDSIQEFAREMQKGVARG